MPFQPAPNTALVELLFGGYGNQSWQSNLHFTLPNFTLADMNTLAQAFETLYNASNLINSMSHEAIFAQCRVTDLRSEGAPQVVNSVTSGGTQNYDYVPLGSPIVCTLRTALRGRSYRGRIYWSGIIVNLFTNGTYQSAAYTAVEQFFTTLNTPSNVGGWQMVVLSRFHNHVELAEAVPTPVTAVQVRVAEAGSQRRRNNRA